jgi:hypothetical protein
MAFARQDKINVTRRPSRHVIAVVRWCALPLLMRAAPSWLHAWVTSTHGGSSSRSSATNMRARLVAAVTGPESRRRHSKTAPGLSDPSAQGPRRELPRCESDQRAHGVAPQRRQAVLRIGGKNRLRMCLIRAPFSRVLGTLILETAIWDSVLPGNG